MYYAFTNEPFAPMPKASLEASLLRVSCPVGPGHPLFTGSLPKLFDMLSGLNEDVSLFPSLGCLKGNQRDTPQKGGGSPFETNMNL